MLPAADRRAARHEFECGACSESRVYAVTRDCQSNCPHRAARRAGRGASRNAFVDQKVDFFSIIGGPRGGPPTNLTTIGGSPTDLTTLSEVSNRIHQQLCLFFRLFEQPARAARSLDPIENLESRHQSRVFMRFTGLLSLKTDGCSTGPGSQNARSSTFASKGPDQPTLRPVY